MVTQRNSLSVNDRFHDKNRKIKDDGGVGIVIVAVVVVLVSIVWSMMKITDGRGEGRIKRRLEIQKRMNG
mgnify:CR=1 FL=1